MQIAVNAGKGQVVEFIRAAVKSGNNVFDVKSRQRRVILVKLAILATPSRPGRPTTELYVRVSRIRLFGKSRITVGRTPQVGGS